MSGTFKTQPAFRTVENGALRHRQRLRLTILWHPELNRIGRYADLCDWDRALSEAVKKPLLVGRNQPMFSDGQPLCDPHVSRQALSVSFLQSPTMPLEHVLKVDADEHADVRMGPSQSASLLITEAELLRGQPLRFGHGVVLYLRLVPVAESTPAADALLASRLIGASPEMMQLRAQVARIAQSDLPVLLIGESGCGKEVVASAVHALSARAQQPFLALNVAAIPETLVAAELFGVAKGAYTGAEARAGAFTKAHQGTLFLDEIGDTPQAHQIQLLRALEQGQIQPVGGDPRQVNVRALAATDGSIDEQDGFRRALRHRLAGYMITIPPLRERPEDIGPQVMAFLAEAGPSTVETNPEASGERPEVAAYWARFFYRALLADWPGNSRELRYAALRHLAGEGEISAVSAVTKPESGEKSAPPVESEALYAVFSANDYEISKTATALGMTRQSLYRRLEKLPEFVCADTLTDQDIRSALRHSPSLSAAARSLEVSVHALKPRLRRLGVL